MSELKLFNHAKCYYIAICEHGYGVHEIAAAAIRIAQDAVPAKAKPSQLLIYRSDIEVEPVGFTLADGPTWPENGVKLRGKRRATSSNDQRKLTLVGLTNTHSLFVQAPRV
jgi:hypothetical protein